MSSSVGTIRTNGEDRDSFDENGACHRRCPLQTRGMTKGVLAAIAEVLPDDGRNHIARLDVRRGWGNILNIRLYATASPATGGRELETKLRRAINAAMGDERHSIEFVWGAPG
jgi:hypothetical protein